MKQIVRLIAVFLCLVLSVNPFDLPAIAQSPSPTPANAPVPAQIAAAHSVFLSNLGADANFPVNATQAYNDIYKALTTWGRYQLAGAPEQADLIFQLRGVSTLTTYSGAHGTTYTVNNPAFQLTIVDPKSNVTLWTITSPVALAGSKQTLARWLAISETNLVSRIKVVAGEQLTPTETADLTTVPNYHRGRHGAHPGRRSGRIRRWRRTSAPSSLRGLSRQPEGLSGRLLQRQQHPSLRVRRRIDCYPLLAPANSSASPARAYNLAHRLHPFHQAYALCQAKLHRLPVGLHRTDQSGQLEPAA